MIKMWGITVKDETCKAIGEFCIAYSQFEARYFNNGYNADNSKCIVINNVSEEELNLTNRIRELLVDNDKKFVSEIDAEKSIINRLQIRGKKEQHYCDCITPFLSNKCNEEDKIKACIYIGSRIRNNLLHGIKDIKNLDSQIEIFKVLKDFFVSIIINSSIEVK